MVFGPDSTTLYLGFRAPLVPTATRKNAVIAPIQNFESWFNNGAPSGSPIIGSPIELNLGGRAIRDLTRLANGTYIIVAGDAGGAQMGALYKWSGQRTDLPIRLITPTVDSLNMEGVMPVYAAGGTSTNGLQVITDKGGDVLYNDGTEAKDFGDLQLRKFRSDVVTVSDLTLPTGITVTNRSTQALSIYPNASTGPVTVRFSANVAGAMLLSVTDMSSRLLMEKMVQTAAGINEVRMDLSYLSKGQYILHMRSESVDYSEKLLLK